MKSPKHKYLVIVKHRISFKELRFGFSVAGHFEGTLIAGLCSENFGSISTPKNLLRIRGAIWLCHISDIA